MRVLLIIIEVDNLEIIWLILNLHKDDISCNNNHLIKKDTRIQIVNHKKRRMISN